MAKAVTRDVLLGLRKKSDESYARSLTEEILSLIRSAASKADRDTTSHCVKYTFQTRDLYLQPILYANLKEVFPDCRVTLTVEPLPLIQRLFCHCRYQCISILIDWS